LETAKGSCPKNQRLEEDEVFLEAAKVLLLLKKLDSLVVVFSAGHHKHLAQDVLWGQKGLVRVVLERKGV
jgi:hypothetical protein